MRTGSLFRPNENAAHGGFAENVTSTLFRKSRHGETEIIINTLFRNVEFLLTRNILFAIAKIKLFPSAV